MTIHCLSLVCSFLYKQICILGRGRERDVSVTTVNVTTPASPSLAILWRARWCFYLMPGWPKAWRAPTCSVCLWNCVHCCQVKIQVTNGREAGRVFVIPYEGVTAEVHQEGKGKILRCFYLLCFTLASLLFEVSACLSFCVNIRSPFAAFLCQVTSVDYFSVS